MAGVPHPQHNQFRGGGWSGSLEVCVCVCVAGSNLFCSISKEPKYKRDCGKDKPKSPVRCQQHTGFYMPATFRRFIFNRLIAFLEKVLGVKAHIEGSNVTGSRSAAL